MDPRIVGFWRVRGIDMIQERTVGLIGGAPGEVVEFTVDGKYVMWGDPSRPMNKRFRWHDADPPGLDFWIVGLEPLAAKCVYSVTSTELHVCIAGNAGVRPTEVRRDDRQLWCVMTLDRCEGPPPAKRRRRR